MRASLDKNRFLKWISHRTAPRPKVVRLLFCSIWCLLGSCGEDTTCVEAGGAISEHLIEVAPASELTIEGAFEVLLVPTTDPAHVRVQVEAPKDVHRWVEVSEGFGRIKIHLRRCVISQVPIRLRVEMPALEHLSVSGATTIRNAEIIHTKSFVFEASGASKAELDILAESLRVNGEGAAWISLSGEAGLLDIQTTGTAEIEAIHLPCQQASVRIEGEGFCSVTPTKRLEVFIAGSGQVQYGGQPEEILPTIEGTGAVRAYREP